MRSNRELNNLYNSLSPFATGTSIFDSIKEPITKFAGHKHGSICAICYSPDGRQIATGGSRPYFRIWDSDTGEMILEHARGALTLISICYSPDGKRLASGDKDGRVCVWNASDGQVISDDWSAHSSRVIEVVYSPDNEHVASCGDDRMVRVWRAEDLTLSIELPEHPDVVNSVSFSPDGCRLATGCNDGKIRIFNVVSGLLALGPLEGHTDRVFAVTYSPDGNQLASCSGDRTIRTWDALTATALLTLPTGHTRGVFRLSYSPNGDQLLSGSFDTSLRLWDSNTGKLIGGPVKGHGTGMSAVSFAPDGTRFVTGATDGTMRVWNSRTLEVVSPELADAQIHQYRLTGPFRGHTGKIYEVAYFPDGDRIASASEDGSIRIWDARTGKEIGAPWITQDDQVKSIAISTDGMRLVSGIGRTIQVWDTRSGDIVLGPLEGHSGDILCVTVSPNNRLIATSSWPGEIFVWDSQTGEMLSAMERPHSTIPEPTISFSPDGSRLAGGGVGIYVWDLSTAEIVVGPLTRSPGFISSIAFSPDGLRIVSGQFLVGNPHVWDAKTGTHLLELNSSSSFASVSYSPDGTRICGTSDNGTISLWHASTGEMIFGQLQGHYGVVSSAAFSLDGKFIVTGSHDCSMILRDVETGEIINFPDPESIHSDNAGSIHSDVSDSLLDLPATGVPALSPGEHIQEISLGFPLDAPGPSFSSAVPTSAGQQHRSFIIFSRLRRVIANIFHSPRSPTDAHELQERRPRLMSRPVRIAYGIMRTFVAVAPSPTPPRPQALRDVSDDGTASDGGGSARQHMTDGENAAAAQTSNHASASAAPQVQDVATSDAAQRTHRKDPHGTPTMGVQATMHASASGAPQAEAEATSNSNQRTRQENQRGTSTMQPSAPYAGTGPLQAAPPIIFDRECVEPEYSFERDCCECCPTWCTCLHP